MPPKVKITKEDIISASLDIVRKEGPQAVNARNVAKLLGCSTQPVFSNFETMEKLLDATLNAAYALYLSFLKDDVESGSYPAYKAMGMAYIRFADTEKELFKLLFMRDRSGSVPVESEDFSASVDMIMKANDISKETATLMHLEMWVSVHGIATILATSYLTLDTELISSMLSDIYLGLQNRHVKKENSQ